jgi:hypothetical protein
MQDGHKFIAIGVTCGKHAPHKGASACVSMDLVASPNIERIETRHAEGLNRVGVGLVDDAANSDAHGPNLAHRPGRFLGCS